MSRQFKVVRQRGPAGSENVSFVEAVGPWEAVKELSALKPTWTRGNLRLNPPLVYFTNSDRGTTWWHVWGPA